MTAATILLDGTRVLVAAIVCAAVPLALHVAALPRLARWAIPAGVLAAVSLWLVAGAVVPVAPYAIRRRRPSCARGPTATRRSRATICGSPPSIT